MRTPRPPTWTIIVPVKQTRHAKTRLTGYSPEQRRVLALAFALDTVSAALACPAVASVVTVTSDPSAPEFHALGAIVVPDVPDAGLNPALDYAASVVRESRPNALVAAVSSDLPALRAGDLDIAIGAAEDAEAWFVADAAGTGTTMLASSVGRWWRPLFGARSRAAHRAAGLAEVQVPGIERLRRDVDTPVDLWDAARLGLGQHTRAALDAFGLDPRR